MGIEADRRVRFYPCAIFQEAFRTHRIMKKTRKLPKKEIVKSEKYRRDYLSRSLE